MTLAIDSVVLHPIAGPIILAALLFVMFQAVFAWSEAPIGMIEGWFAAVGTFVTQQVPEGIVRSFLVDGVINGVGSVVVFLPQILEIGRAHLRTPVTNAQCVCRF